MMMRRNSRLRLTDVEGGANVGMLFYNPLNLLERYNAPDTLKCQHTFKLTAGHCLYSDMGRIFCSIVADTFGWHDTVCGNTTKASVAAQMGGDAATRRDRNDWQQNGHDSFLVEAAKYGLGRRDLAANVNWFSKVAVADDGALVARRRAPPRPGASVELRFEMDTLVLFHTCPHPLNPAPTYPRKPVRYEILDGPACRAPTIAYRLSAPENMRGFENNRIFHTGCCGRPADDQGKPARSRGRAVPQGRAAGDYWMHVVRKGETLPHRRPRRQSGRRHAVLQRRRSAERYSATDTIREQGNIYLSTGTTLHVGSLPADADHHRRHRRPPRHARRRLRDREQHGALCARKEDRCTPAATAFCSRSPRTSSTG